MIGFFARLCITHHSSLSTPLEFNGLINKKRSHTHMLFPVCVACGNGLARISGDVSSDVRVLECEE